MDNNIDSLLDTIADAAANRSGVPMSILTARGVRLRPTLGRPIGNPHATAWTPDERQTLRQSIGLLTDNEIGTLLGRSRNAIKIKRTRWGLPAHSRRPGWMTGNEAARALGLDIHAICTLHRRGILPFTVLSGPRHILNIRKAVLYRWAVNPEHWIYFKREKITDPHLARLIALESTRWGDEWWTAGQARDYLGLGDDRRLNYMIRKGILRGKKWGNWWLKRSEVTKPGLTYSFGKGNGHEVKFAPAQDEFIILGAAIGVSYNAMNRMMQWTRKANANHRWHKALRRQVERGERAYLGIQARPGSSGLVFADWREHRTRFPSVARSMDRYAAGLSLTRNQALMVRGVLARWLDWHNLECPCMVSPKAHKAVVRRKLNTMRAVLEAAGLKPCG